MVGVAPCKLRQDKIRAQRRKCRGSALSAPASSTARCMRGVVEAHSLLASQNSAAKGSCSSFRSGAILPWDASLLGPALKSVMRTAHVAGAVRQVSSGFATSPLICRLALHCRNTYCDDLWRLDRSRAHQDVDLSHNTAVSD